MGEEGRDCPPEIWSTALRWVLFGSLASWIVAGGVFETLVHGYFVGRPASEGVPPAARVADVIQLVAFRVWVPALVGIGVIWLCRNGLRTPSASSCCGVFDVRRFGAKGDGTGNDAPAISAAINAARGGTVCLPPGTYRITEAIHGGADGTTIQGAGAWASVIRNEGTDAAFIVPPSINTYCVRDLRVLGAPGSGDAIRLSPLFRRLRFINLQLNPIRDGIDATAGDGTDVYMESVRVDGARKGFNFDLAGSTSLNTLTLVNTYADGCTDSGYIVSNVVAATFIGTMANACGVDGYTLGGGTVECGVVMQGASSEGNTRTGFAICGDGHFVLSAARAVDEPSPFVVDAPRAQVVLIEPQSSGKPPTIASLEIKAAGTVSVFDTNLLHGGLDKVAANMLKFGFGTAYLTSG